MSDNTSSFSVLPWTVPESLQNFVPECSRIFVKGDYSLFICWRANISLLFTFRSRFESLSSQTPIYTQTVTPREQILDVIVLDHSIFFVSHTGLFQTVQSKDRCPWEILNHLGDCKPFSLSEAFELSSLKKVKSVTTVPGMKNDNFVAITYSEGNCRIDAELYSVSHETSFKCQLLAVICISNTVRKVRYCYSSFLTNDQAAFIFRDLRDAEILLISLDTGMLFCLPINVTEKTIPGMRPVPKLVYQSQWPIVGHACPTDGFNIHLFLEGGTVVNISPLNKQSGKQDHSSLSYSSFTLSYPINCFAALKSDVFFVSDAFTTNMVHIISPSQVDMQTIPVKGITALSAIPCTELVLASTFHNSFYLLNASKSEIKSENISQSWAGCSLDLSLQLVEEMKVQTQLLSQIKQELQEENNIINALSTVARAHLLRNHFSIAAKVSRTFREQERGEQDPEVGSNNSVYQIAVEVRNNSSEEFAPFLWLMCIDVKCPDGQTISKNIPLTRTFNKNLPFSSLINIPYLCEKLCFPIFVAASLVANIKDKNSKTQWLKIRLSEEITLDVSHFFTVSMHAPQQHSPSTSDLLKFLDQLQGNAHSDVQKEDLKKMALMTSYTIPIPDEYRQPHKIVEKLMSNCQHNQKLLIEKEFYNQSDKTVIWLYVLHETVQLIFRKSCTSILISCCNLDLLHSVKLSLATMFNGDVSSSGASSSADAACCKARNINAVLETFSLEENKDIKQILDIYQDLRNNVSSQLY